MKKKFLYALSALLFIGVAGCNKIEDFGDTNVNPNAVNDPIPGSLLANAMNAARGISYQVNPGYYAQYFSETQYPSVSVYTLQQVSFTGSYSGSLYDLKNILGLSSSTTNQKNVANILMQYTYWDLTNLFGDLPYSEALMGVEKSTPKYDSQEDIYKGILSTLKTVATSFDGSAIPGDIMMNGSVDAWKRINNSLRLMVALQLSKKYPGAGDYAATEYKAALADAGGVITTNAQNWKITPASGYKSDYWTPYDGRKDLAVSDTFMDLLKSLGDTRTDAFGGASEVPGSTAPSNIGVPYGQTRAIATKFTDDNPTWARVLRGDLRSELAPVYILTAAQVALARAEAANLGWTTDVAATQYAAGITLSFEQWKTPLPAGYLLQPNVALGIGNAQKIATQRYIATYPDGARGWDITRKTGFPVLTPAPDAQNASKTIPNRLAYAIAEYLTNQASVRAAAAALPGGDTQEAKVWWAR